MPIQFKVACTPKEIDDALWLRHHVYVTEEGRFGGRPLPDERMVDRFDVIPKVAHVLAYDGDDPVAGIRLNCNMGLGTPPEAYFDFSRHLAPNAGAPPPPAASEPIVASGGMLAVRHGWRKRRDVILAIYHVAAGVFYTWNATHIIAAVSHTTASLYGRMGFKPVADKIWVEKIGDAIVPLVAKAEDCYRWAFGDQLAPTEPIWEERREVSCKRCHGKLVEGAIHPPRIGWEERKRRARVG